MTLTEWIIIVMVRSNAKTKIANVFSEEVFRIILAPYNVVLICYILLAIVMQSIKIMFLIFERVCIHTVLHN